MKEKLTTKTTNINGNYHTRLYNGDTLVSEMACKLKEDVGYCCRELLRWYDKLGGTSKMADASRGRNKNISPKGKVWRVEQKKVL